MSGPYCNSCRYFRSMPFGGAECTDPSKIILDRNGNSTNSPPEVSSTTSCRNWTSEHTAPDFMIDQTPHIILDKELRRDIDAIIQRLRRGEQPRLPPLQGDGVNGNDIAPPPEELGSIRLRAGRRSRERSLALTKLQEAVMWLGMDLKAINDESPGAIANPYPNSKDPSNTKIDPTADGLKL